MDLEWILHEINVFWDNVENVSETKNKISPQFFFILRWIEPYKLYNLFYFDFTDFKTFVFCLFI